MMFHARLCALLPVAGARSAQEFRAGLGGIVRDAQGAVMPQVSIEATNLKTNETLRTTTNACGYYALPVLPIGAYRLTASMAGFKKAMREGLELRVGEQVQQDLVLEIGAVSARHIGRTLRPYLAAGGEYSADLSRLSMFKAFQLREGLKLQLRAEAFNATNSPQFGNPSTSLASTTPGVVTLTQTNDPRNIQLALKLVWQKAGEQRLPASSGP